MTEECPLCGVHMDVEMKGDVGAYIVCGGCVTVTQEMKEVLVESLSKITTQGVHLDQVHPMAFVGVTSKMNIQFKVFEAAAIRMTEFGGC